MMPDIRKKLQFVANKFAFNYNARVYLFGSALLDWRTKVSEIEPPHDYDLCIVIPDADFERLFYSVKQWLNDCMTEKPSPEYWSKAKLKHKEEVRYWQQLKLRLDLKFFPESFFKSSRGSCYQTGERIDTSAE